MSAFNDILREIKWAIFGFRLFSAVCLKCHHKMDPQGLHTNRGKLHTFFKCDQCDHETIVVSE